MTTQAQKRYRDPAVRRAWWAENKGRKSVERRERYSTPVGAMKNIVWHAASRARKNNVTIDKDYLMELAAKPPGSCQCCGVTLNYVKDGTMKNRPQSPSLDRINNAFGYVRGNVGIICFKCNNQKGNSTADDLRKLLAYSQTATFN